jgi:manganese/iron transport system ATP-binding protein
MHRLIQSRPVHDPHAPALQAVHLEAHYDGRHALEDISFELHSGERLALVGPNGAGKTTLLMLLSGARRPDHGSVKVYGQQPGRHVCIAYVPQRSRVDWDFPVTVSEVVMMGRIRRIGLFRWPSRKDWQVVERSLAKVGMSAFHDRSIGELSGGQQQRVFLAQALAQQAEVVLMDEPLNGLDLPTQEDIFRILAELSRDGVTTIVATHDLNLAAERFDRVLLLNRRLIAIGQPPEVLTRPFLMQAYGGQMHVLSGEGGAMVLTDTCCDGEETGA